MRDIDLLVPPDQALAAWEVLLAAGYGPLAEAKIPLAEVMRLEQHLPATGNAARHSARTPRARLGAVGAARICHSGGP